MGAQHTPKHDPWAGCRVHIMPSQRPKPKAGDRRTTKKHGEQVRVHETHNGMWVRNGSRYCFVWVSLDDPRAESYVAKITRSTS